MNDFSLEAFYAIAVAGYKYELHRLIQAFNTPEIKTALPNFVKKKKLLDMQRRAVFKRLLNDPQSNDGFSMDASLSIDSERLLYCHLDIAAACAFFDGWKYPVSEMVTEDLDIYLNNALQHIAGNNEAKSRYIADRLNRSDTMRVVMLMKLLGFLPHDSQKFRQLSLGAFVGTRDIEYMHQQPEVRPEGPITGPSGKVLNRLPEITFGTVSHDARDVVLIDIDPSVASRYEVLNRDHSDQVLALNMDVLLGLDRLNEEISSGARKARDLVMLFRLEPMMLPDVEVFYRHLKNVITEKAKFIMTVGAGDDEEAYRQRKFKMDEVASGFRSRGFRVERIKWCGGKTAEEQRELPLHGIGNFSSYDIIYAEINREAL